MALNCRQENLASVSTVSIVVYAGKSHEQKMKIQDYKPGSYFEPFTTTVDHKQHYWEVQEPILVSRITDEKLDDIMETIQAATQKLYSEKYAHLSLVLQVIKWANFLQNFHELKQIPSA